MLFQNTSHPGFITWVVAVKLVGVVLAPLGQVRLHVDQLLELHQELLVDALPPDALNLDRWAGMGKLCESADVGEEEHGLSVLPGALYSIVYYCISDLQTGEFTVPLNLYIIICLQLPRPQTYALAMNEVIKWRCWSRWRCCFSRGRYDWNITDYFDRDDGDDPRCWSQEWLISASSYFPLSRHSGRSKAGWFLHVKDVSFFEILIHNWWKRTPGQPPHEKVDILAAPRPLTFSEISRVRQLSG